MVWREEADRLRAEGLSIRQIAERIGMGHAVVGEHFKPHYCACGNRRYHHRSQCWECYATARRLAHDRIIEAVAWMYNAGWLHREIAETLGRPTEGRSLMEAGQLVSPEICEARKRGLIGYRYAACAARAAR